MRIIWKKHKAAGTESGLFNVWKRLFREENKSEKVCLHVLRKGPDRSGLCVLLAVPRADRTAVGGAGLHPDKGSVKYRLHGTAGCRSVLISRHSLKNAGSENFRVFIEERTGRKFKKPGSILTFNIHDLISLFRK